VASLTGGSNEEPPGSPQRQESKIFFDSATAPSARTGETVPMEAQDPRFDPLLYHFKMPLHGVYYPLGFPLEIATNSHNVLDTATESWRNFRQIFPNRPLQFRIGVLDGGPADCPPAPVLRANRSLLARVADAENFAISDVKHGDAFAWLTRSAVEDQAYLRWYFIEGVVWDLLDTYLTPIQAACVQLHERGVLLCGEAGAGKSSLAFACALKGWKYLSDDSSRLVRGQRELVVLGNPYQMRFRESAAELFPQLRNLPLTNRAGGEVGLQLATADAPEIDTVTQASVDYIVFLKREPNGPARLAEFPKDRALRRFEQVLLWGEPETIDAHKRSLARLLSAEIFELRYSDLSSAVERLGFLVQERQTTAMGTLGF